MQVFHPSGHGALNALNPAAAGEEAALELQHRFLAGLVYVGADNKQSVRVPGTLIPGCVAASDDDLGRCLLDDLEVVYQFGADLIGGGRELVDGPELRGSRGPLVLAREVRTLEAVA